MMGRRNVRGGVVAALIYLAYLSDAGASATEVEFPIFTLSIPQGHYRGPNDYDLLLAWTGTQKGVHWCASGTRDYVLTLRGIAAATNHPYDSFLGPVRSAACTDPNGGRDMTANLRSDAAALDGTLIRYNINLDSLRSMCIGVGDGHPGDPGGVCGNAPPPGPPFGPGSCGLRSSVKRLTGQNIVGDLGVGGTAVITCNTDVKLSLQLASLKVSAPWDVHIWVSGTGFGDRTELSLTTPTYGNVTKGVPSTLNMHVEARDRPTSGSRSVTAVVRFLYE